MVEEVCVVVETQYTHLGMRRNWPRVTVGIGTWISVGGEGKNILHSLGGP